MLEFRIVSGVAEIHPNAWNRLGVPADNPFMEWEWFHQLESSSSIGPDTGWIPCHLTAWRRHALAAVVPLYLKTREMPEYTSEDFQINGYIAAEDVYPFPRLVGTVPATPAPVYRFLISSGENEAAMIRLLLEQVERICADGGIHSCAFMFVDRFWNGWNEMSGYHGLLHPGFIWNNTGLANWEDFLGGFRSNQRKNIRKEQRAMKGEGIRITPLTGDGIGPDLAPFLWECYCNTADHFGDFGIRFLTRRFFEGICERFAERLLVITAERGGEKIASAFLVHKGGRLFGRYWGARENVRHLHFNVCYYTPLNWAIRHGCRSMNPGVGGAHKLRRGFELEPNACFYRLFPESLHRKIGKRLIPLLNLQNRRTIQVVNRRLPRKQEGVRQDSRRDDQHSVTQAAGIYRSRVAKYSG